MDIKFTIDEEEKELETQLENESPKGKKKKSKRKHKQKIPRTPLEKIKKVFFIFAIIATIVLGTISVSPVAVGLFGFVVFMFWLVFAAVITIVSFGIVWASPGFCKFNEGFMNFWKAIFEAPDKIIETTKKIIPIVSGVCGGIVLVFLILAIICFAKQKKHNTTTFVFALIFTALSALFIGIGFSLINNIK